MDEDDDLSNDMEISIDEALVDDDYALTRGDYDPSVKSLLALPMSRLADSLDEGDQEAVYEHFLNAISPVAFECVLTSNEKLDIPLNQAKIKALEYELLAALLKENDPLAGIAEFKKLETPSNVCGKIFKHQQFTYSCRDCAVDSTCVMCSECFNNSIHVNCNYKMNQSSGGGCCDCGDPEAWTNGYACRLHQPKADDEKREETAPERRLKKRAGRLFLAMIRLAYEVLIQDVEVFDPDELEAEPPPRASGFDNVFRSSHLIRDQLKNPVGALPYVVALYNDEVHTYDEVERMLKCSVGATSDQAKGYAIVVDRTGRTLLHQGTRADCRRVQKVVIEKTEQTTDYQRQRGYDGAGPIKSLVIDRRLLGLQEVAIRLLKRLNLLSDDLELFRNVYVAALQEVHWERETVEVEYDGNPLMKPREFVSWRWHTNPGSKSLMSSVELMLLSDVHTWKNVRSTMIRALVESFLKLHENKLSLAKIFSKHYTEIYGNVNKDDHDVKYSVSSITVQLFTTPSVVYALLEGENTFESIMEVALERFFPTNKDTGEREFHFKQRGNRYYYYHDLTDISYFSSHMPDDKLASARSKVVSGMMPFLELMRLFQGTDAVMHSRESHVDSEPQWDVGITFVMTVMQVLKQLQTWCSADPIILRNVAHEMIQILRTRRIEAAVPAIVEDLQNYQRHERIVWDGCYRILSIDINHKPVGVHHMFSRFLFELLVRDIEVIERYSRDELILLATEAMAAQCLAAQEKAGYWKRNGQSLQNVIYWYSRPNIRDVMALQDIKAMQLVCCLFDSPDDFLATLINGVGLNPDSMSPTADVDDQGSSIGEKLAIRQQRQVHKWIASRSLSEYQTKLIAEFLSILIRILTARFEHSSTISERDDIRLRLLHYLAIRSVPWSKVAKYLHFGLSSEQVKVAEGMLSELADTVTINNTKCYKIKPARLSEWDRNYLHYEHEEQSHALETIKVLVKNEPDWVKESIWLPKENFSLRGHFTKVLDLLDSALFQKVILNFLQHSELKQRIVDKCIYLCILSVQHNRGGWIKEQKVIEILDKLKEDGADVNGLAFIKEKLGVAENMEQEQNEADERALRKKRAMEMRKKMMAGLAAQSARFIDNNADQFQPKDSSDEEFHSAEEELNTEEPTERNFFNMKERHSIEESWTCVMCQADEETTMKPDNRHPMVMVGFIEKSSVLDRGPRKKCEVYEQMARNEIFEEFPHFTPLHISEGTHLSTCGHAFHLNCLAKIKAQQKSAYLRSSNQMNGWLDSDEYTCMLCNRLCNIEIPIIPKRIHHETRKLEVSPMKDKKRKLWEWMREIEFDLAPEKRQQKKTYVIRLGTLDVTKGEESGDKKTEEEKEDKIGWKEEIEKAEKETESMEIESVATMDKAMIENSGDESEKEEDSQKSVSLEFNKSCVYSVFQFVQNFNNGHFSADILPSASNLTALVKSFCYVLMSSERLCSFNKKPVLGALPVRRDKCLEYTLRCALACTKGVFLVKDEKNKQRKRLKQDMRLIGNGLVTSMFPDCIKDRDTTPILLCDLFSYYVMLVLSSDFISHKGNKRTTKETLFDYVGNTSSRRLFWLFVATLFLPSDENSTRVEHNFLRLVVAAHIVQVGILSSDVSIASANSLPVQGVPDDELENFAQLINQLRTGAHLPPLQCSPTVIYSYFIHCITPLLRCVIVFRQYLNLYNIEYITSDVVDRADPLFASVCNLLSLESSLTSFFDADGSSLEPQAQKWIKHMIEVKEKFKVETDTISFPRLSAIPSLVKLPNDYRSVVETSLEQKCPKNPSSDLSAPAMCLICGETVCALSKCCTKQSYFDFNKVGGATAHAIKCTKGIGLFMLIRNNARNNPLMMPYLRYYQPCSGVMISVRRNKICNSSFDLPYVDAHGEPDRGMNRGSPLTLSGLSFGQIESMWLGHEIAEKIGRAQSMTRNLNQHNWEVF